MGIQSDSYLIPAGQIDRWWLELQPERLACEVEIMSSSKERDTRTYRKVKFTRGSEEVVAMSLPGPRDRPEVFLLWVLPSARAYGKVEFPNTLRVNIDTAPVRRGANCVHRE
jgi:hypothetical protein